MTVGGLAPQNGARMHLVLSFPIASPCSQLHRRDEASANDPPSPRAGDRRWGFATGVHVALGTTLNARHPAAERRS
jgi:hypothetical protein